MEGIVFRQDNRMEGIVFRQDNRMEGIVFRQDRVFGQNEWQKIF